MLLMNKSVEALHDQEEQKWRHGTSLFETSFYMKERGSRAINQHVVRNIGYEAHDPFDERIGEANMGKEHAEV